MLRIDLFSDLKKIVLNEDIAFHKRILFLWKLLTNPFYVLIDFIVRVDIFIFLPYL